MSSQILLVVLTIYGIFIDLTENKPLFAVAKQQQLEQISSKHIKNFKDFIFPSETTEPTGTKGKHVDNKKIGDFVFPTEYKESTVPKVIILKSSKTTDYLSSTKAVVSTESSVIKKIPDKRIETVDFIFPPDLASSKLTNHKDKSLEIDNRISLACTLALCWGKK
ncbi:unnamed protein product [Chironomus riparius]|uniref:Uncharacterized protein n=1 Tax=Chironomus riparius TaxID=315576 RepID=A0A9N9WMN4_9DIPT|nr:unnamed protein product [Chironomus riparius]